MIANTKGGYNDLKYPTKHNYKSTKEHRLWISMLKRCMLGGEVQLRYPTYIGCTVSDNFCHYSYFYQPHRKTSRLKVKDISWKVSLTE